jgi:hypothetical protein
MDGLTWLLWRKFIMNYPEFKNTLTSLVNNFLGELDSAYGDSELTINQKMEKFKAISVKYDFPIDDVIAAM